MHNGNPYFFSKMVSRFFAWSLRQVPWVLPQNFMPQESLPTRAFLLTISVKGDLSPECQEELVHWIKKNTVFHYIVIEHGQSGLHRHMHACFVFKTPRDPRKLKGNVWTRFVQKHHTDSIARHAVKLQVMPGPDWYNTYLKKESGVEVLSDTWEPESAEDYYPTVAIQEALMAKSKLAGVACPWLDEDTITWSLSTYENTPVGALQYLKDRMFVKKNLVPISDKRKLTEKALLYWEYRNQVISPSEREIFLLKQLQDGPSYEVPGSIRGQFPAVHPSI